MIEMMLATGHSLLNNIVIELQPSGRRLNRVVDSAI
jgi:hypothetical protein